MRALLPFLIVFPMAAQPMLPQPSTVRGTAEAVVSARPDRARVNIGVITQAATAQAAAAQNTKQLEAVLAALRTAMGPRAELKTINYSLNPNYRYPRESGQPVLTGYTAGNTVQVTTDDLSSVGKIIDAATQAGANSIQSLDFLLKDERAIRSQALREAALQARANAESMAAALGLKARKVVSVEQSEAVPIRPVGNMPMVMEARAAAPPISPGRLEVRATVVVTLAVE